MKKKLFLTALILLVNNFVYLFAQSKITFTDVKSSKVYTATDCRFNNLQVFDYRVGEDDVIHFYQGIMDENGEIHYDGNSDNGIIKKTQPGPALNTIRSLMDSRIGKGELLSDRVFVVQVPVGDYNWWSEYHDNSTGNAYYDLLLGTTSWWNSYYMVFKKYAAQEIHEAGLLDSLFEIFK
jgi:hypothetical protein